MQAAILPMRAGWLWLQYGYQLFRRQPMAMFFWSLVTSFLISVSYLVPLLGQLALIACTPLLTFITLNACRHIASGRRMQLAMWLEPLRERETRLRLLGLGLTYMFCCLVGGVIATVPFLNDLQAAMSASPLNEDDLLMAMRGPFITFGLLYLIISGLFWHAPALIGWHKTRMIQALFFSMVACWRNKWPFLLYGLSWAGIFLGFQFGMGLLVDLGFSAGMVQLLLTPVNIVVAAILYCSFYPAYVSVFGTNYPTNA